MNTTPIRVPVTDVPDLETETMSARPALASLTSKTKRVKLRLNAMAFAEACEVVGTLSVSFGQAIDESPWLELASVESRACLALLLDVYDAQMLPHVLSLPELVTLNLSRCEALVLWKLWMMMGLQPSQAPSYAAVMDELHHLLS